MDSVDTLGVNEDMEVMNAQMENTSNEYSFLENDDDNIHAINRENEVDTTALSVDPELIGELRGLKRNIYNAVVFGPPVGSEEAQNLQNLEVYESLLLELNNLLASIFEDQTTSFTVQQFARFPEANREPAHAYCMKVVGFKNTNTKPFLNDILVDHFDRMLKEHPY